MTKSETRKVIGGIITVYPNYKPADLEGTVAIWHDMLSDYSYQDIYIALKAYIHTNASGFAPTIGQLVEKIHTISNHDELSELEAWGMVSKAIANGGYNAVKEFEKLPKSVQKAVGSASQIKAWALSDNNEGVSQSNFLRSYRIVVAREKELAKLPNDIKELIAEKANLIAERDTKQIEGKE